MRDLSFKFANAELKKGVLASHMPTKSLLALKTLTQRMCKPRPRPVNTVFPCPMF